MKILFVNAYFYPENIAFSHLEKDIIEGLQNAGHEISVICPTPTRGVSDEVHREYKRRKREEINGVKVQRYAAPKEGRNPIIRAFRYFWCNFWEYHIGKKYRDIDAVFAVSTPPTQGWIAGKLAKKLKTPFIYSLQDVFPDSLVTTGLVGEDSLIYKMGAKIERKTYRLCSRIIVISESIKRNLIEKGVDEEKLTVITNWIDTDVVYPVPKHENKLFEEYGIDREKFNVVYAGNFGASQGADVILKAAELLKGNDEISFLIFGGGTQFADAREYVKQHDLRNVFINPLLPVERSAEVYSLGDVALITCKKGVGKAGMPSKTWSIMACGVPIIAAFDTDSELAEILNESKAGICVDPEDPAALAQAIETAAKNKTKATAERITGDPDIDLAANPGINYVVACASKHICVARYVECF